LTYWKNLQYGIQSSWKGLRLSLRHLWQARRRHSPTHAFQAGYFQENTGIVTLQYPKEAIPTPDNGRYKLHNEMDDCIVCDKCAKICPVDCIDIEAIKATEQIGTASDGSPIRLYAAKFDIDMAKCCFCGLCTTVCPTECLTMTADYDFSEFVLANMNYEFGNLTPAEAAEKRQLLAQFQKEKVEAKGIKSIEKTEKETEIQPEEAPKPRPVFKPKMTAKPVEKAESEEIQPEETPKPKAVFKPKMTAKPVEKAESEETQPEETPKPKAVFKPKIRPNIKPKTDESE
jgi:formate hydrogenlyase subunit 6/NADH:ubiquinone oxidoreductase subunit I